jgi:UDPglucose 6-dehydrogenase
LSSICVVGAGYVGLVTGACFAELGHQVTCLDIDAARIEGLNRGVVPIYEPNLDELIAVNVARGRLRFTTAYPEAIPGVEFAFIAVNTPSGAEGEADMSFARQAADSIGRHANGHVTIVNKSTMPIGAGDQIATIVARYARDGRSFAVVSNPEFLREGSAVRDFLHPDRIVLGATDRAAADVVATLYASLDAPVIITDLRTAEMIKYASNAFLATKISFINEIASVCEQLGADVSEVARGMGLDARIGAQFLNAGVGFGGSCFPKDVRALAYMAAVNGCHPQLLRAVMEINRDARRSVLLKARAELGTLDERIVAVLGLAFKPNTDDLREAPSLEIIRLLQNEGARVRVYDPAAMEKGKLELRNVQFAATPYAAAESAHALVVLTEWDEFRHLDFGRIRSSMAYPLLLDGRNMFDPIRMAEQGFVYRGMGLSAGKRPRPAPARGESVAAVRG